MRNILVYIAVALLILWGIGATIKLAGSIIHFVLVLAVILLVLHFIRGNRLK